MASIGITRHFHLATHKKIEELGLKLLRPEKLTTWAFSRPTKHAPRPYGAVGGLLWPPENGRSDEEQERLKHMFLHNVDNCWVRSVTEYPDKISIILW